MQRDKKMLETLQRLTRVFLDAELVKLAQIKQKEAPIRQKLKEFEAAQIARRDQRKGGTGFDLAEMSGADQVWKRWAELQKREALKELAKVSEQREQQLARTQKAFGQNEALTRIAKAAQHTGHKSKLS